MQEVQIIEEQPCLRVALRGDIGSENADEFYAAVMNAYRSGDIIFECEGLEFIDSTTLGTFVKILKQVKTGGGTLRLTALSARIKKLFVICALDKIMEIA